MYRLIKKFCGLDIVMGVRGEFVLGLFLDCLRFLRGLEKVLFFGRGVFVGVRFEE